MKQSSSTYVCTYACMYVLHSIYAYVRIPWGFIMRHSTVHEGALAQVIEGEHEQIKAHSPYMHT